MDYFVLKDGEIVGPFRRDEIVARLETEVFEEDDLAQQEGSVHWTPLRALFDGSSPSETNGAAVAPDWKTLGIWMFRRARYMVENDPLRAGFIFLGVGIIVVLLSHWSVLLWLPWFLVASYAGVLLFRRGAAGLATLLLACVLLALVAAFVTLKR
jgi:hypothetical protein